MTIARLDARFAACRSEGRAALIAYIMANDPDAVTCDKLLQAIADGGADVIELGMPFSDPMADGKTIQNAAIRALENGGSVISTFKAVADFRKHNDATPIILMGYFNPVFRYGTERFMQDAAKAGVDGLIIVDVPPEEEAEIVPYADANDLAFIRLLAPTTDVNRAKRLLANASGFVYYISVAGITGGKSAQKVHIAERMRELKQLTPLPVAVGFGIKTPEQAADMAQHADAVVVGSAIVQRIEDNLSQKEKIPTVVKQFITELRGALDKQGTRAA